MTVLSSLTTHVAVLLNPVTLPSGGSGTLSLAVSPTSASAWVDGVAVTLTSGAYSSSESAGVHSLEVTDNGFYPFFNNVTVVGGTTSTVVVALNPVTSPVGADGTLTITVSPASASVWVDGSPVTLNAGSYSASATPGVHSIEITASGYFAYFNNVTIASSAVTTVPVSLNSVTTSTSGNGGVGDTGGS